MNARLSKDPNVLDEPWLRPLPQFNGRRVLGSIVLLERLGAGAMGIVLRGWHIEHGREVAVKVLNPMLAVDSVYVGRFRREAKLAMRITHHNVVRVFDVRCDAKLHYIVMEYVPGESLRDRIERAGAMTVAQASSMFAGIAAGLAEAHALGIVHRDIKPDNVMISTSGRAKLADLGLARQVVDESGATLVGQTALVMGTPQYMSPEQWETPDVKPPCDVWALGATFYFAVTGEAAVPIGAPGPVARWIHENELPALASSGTGAMPSKLVAIHARCVHRESARRYHDAGELCRDLAALQVAEESCLHEPGAGVARVPSMCSAASVPGATERLRLRGWLLRTREARRLGVSRRGRRRTPQSRLRLSMRARIAVGMSLLVALLVALPVALPLAGPAVEQRPDSGSGASAVAARPLADAAANLARGDGAAALRSLAEAAKLRPGIVRDASVARMLQGVSAELCEHWRLCLRQQLDCGVRRCLDRDRDRGRDGHHVQVARRELELQLGEWPDALVSVRCELRPLFDPANGSRAAQAFVPLERGAAARIVAAEDGAYELWLHVEDSMGLTHEVSMANLRFDTRAPIATLAHPLRGRVVARGEPLAVLSDERLERLQFVLGDRVAEGCATDDDQLVWSCADLWHLLPEGTSGGVPVAIRAFDAAGNVGVAAYELQVDDLAPRVAGVRVPAMHAGAVLEVAGWAPDAALVCVQVDGPLRVEHLEVAVAASGRFCIAMPMPETGAYRGHLVAMDAVGNVSEPVSFATWRLPDAQRGVLRERHCEVQRVLDSVIASGAWPTVSLHSACEQVRAASAQAGECLLRVQLWGLDQQFANAVRRGDRCAIERCAKNMVLLQPGRGHELLLAVVLVSRGSARTREARQLLRSHVRAASQAGGHAPRTRERLAYLGLCEAARQCGVELGQVEAWFEDGPVARLRLMYPDHKNLQNRHAGLKRAIARAEREVARQRDSWLRHDDKQRLMTQRSAAADRASNVAYWRQQAVRHDQRKDVHARAMRSKQRDIDRYREELAAIDQAILRMRSFSLRARSSAPASR